MAAPTFTRPIQGTAPNQFVENTADVAALNAALSEIYATANPEDRERAEDAADRADAQADIATTQAGIATGAAQDALTAANAIGPILVTRTYAEADGALSGLNENDVVDVSIDETRSSARTRYRVESGLLAFVMYLSPEFPVDYVLQVGAGLDFPTVAAAFDAAIRRPTRRGRIAEIRIADNHVWASPIVANDADFSYIYLRAASDATIKANIGSSETLIYGNNARMPVLDCRVDMEHTGDTGYAAWGSTVGHIVTNTSKRRGIINAGFIGMVATERANINARTSIWDGAQRNGVNINGHASVNLHPNSEIKNVGQTGSAEEVSALRVSRFGVVSASGLDVSGCSGVGAFITNGAHAYLNAIQANECATGLLSVDGSYVMASRGTFNNNSITDVPPGWNAGDMGRGARARATGMALITQGTADGNQVYGFEAFDGGEIRLGRGARARNNGTLDLRVQNGGIIHAYDCETTNGVNAPQDVSVPEFNFPVAAGVIYAAVVNPSQRVTAWTPVLDGAETYVKQFGRATKIGRQVTLYFEIQLSAKDVSASGNVTISGNPFAANGIEGGSRGPVGNLSFMAGWTPPANTTGVVPVLLTSGNMQLHYATAGVIAGNRVTYAMVGDTLRIEGTITYIAGS